MTATEDENMSTKETLPTMSEEEVAKRLRERANPSFAGAITVEWMKKGADTIDSLRHRLDAAEKELERVKVGAKVNELTLFAQIKTAESNGDELLKALGKSLEENQDLRVKLAQSKEANAALAKELALAAEQVSITSTELTEATEANAELVKDRERLDWLQNHGQTGFWYEELSVSDKPFAAIRVPDWDDRSEDGVSGNIRQAIDAAITKGKQ
jgi:hypothetical protein